MAVNLAVDSVGRGAGQVTTVRGEEGLESGNVPWPGATCECARERQGRVGGGGHSRPGEPGAPSAVKDLNKGPGPHWLVIWHSGPPANKGRGPLESETHQKGWDRLCTVALGETDQRA